MKIDVAYVPRSAARAEKCPTCGAQPGRPCTYMHDLCEGRRLVHARGQRMPWVHNARAGAAKAKLLAGGQAERTARRQRDDARMAAVYEAGGTLEEAAAAVGISPATARKRLDGAGVAIRWPRPAGPRPGRNLERDLRIATARSAGASAREIADREGVTCMTVYNAVKRVQQMMPDAGRSV